MLKKFIINNDAKKEALKTQKNDYLNYVYKNINIKRKNDLFKHYKDSMHAQIVKVSNTFCTFGPLHFYTKDFKYFSLIFSLILTWYVSSIGMVAINKLIFDNMEFNFPILVSLFHFASTGVFIRAYYLLPWNRLEKPKLYRKDFYKYIIPIGLLSSFDIVFSNLSYAYVSISVITVIKSSVVVLTYLISIVIGVDTFDIKLFLTVAFIISSIFLTVPQLEIKKIDGIIYLVFGVVASAGRWVIVHLKLQNSTYSPLQLMSVTQPISAILLIFPTILIDLPKWTNSSTLVLEKNVLLLLLISVILIITIVYVEYRLVASTSSVTLTIFGIGKEVLAILLSVLCFNEKISFRTVLGIFCSVLGLLVYTYLRFTASQKQSQYLDYEMAENEIYI